MKDNFPNLPETSSPPAENLDPEYQTTPFPEETFGAYGLFVPLFKNSDAVQLLVGWKPNTRLLALIACYNRPGAAPELRSASLVAIREVANNHRLPEVRSEAKEFLDSLDRAQAQ